MAFKCQAPIHPQQDADEPNADAAAVLRHAGALATHFMDVVCTSGPGTGKACSVGKLRCMSESLRKGINK